MRSQNTNQLLLEKGTWRRQVADCLESPCTHTRAHTHTRSAALTVVLIRQHVRGGEMKCLSFRKHTHTHTHALSAVRPHVGGEDADGRACLR